MKKILCIVLASAFLFTAVQAQSVQFGIKAGVNAANIDISNGNEYDSKIGMHAGGLVHIHINDHFAIQPELVYSMQGCKTEDDDFKLKLNYVNVPVLAQYMFNGGFRLQTGPQFGFLTSAKTKNGEVEVDVNDEIKSTDFSWAFGAAYLSKVGVGVDFRYNLGISNVSEVAAFETKNRVFQLGLFYQFAK
ncbi:MAG: PorT family protein [Chitinophagaceae bacterium]|nr:PorT family protein [Chitinophagaceae bacterium]